ncbi:MAG: toll/interleukin-1 receptor domain-containing protein [Candidatus Angelobacter sp.]
MANREHLTILKKGFKTWNRWREKKHLLRPNLRNANLRDVDLSSTDLSSADLTAANLYHADLYKANLSSAILREATLRWANLGGSDLSGADLSLADLSHTDLTEANLTGTNFYSAMMDNTELGNVDLSVAKGLEEVNHEGPSSVGIDTIYRSRGNIPEDFLSWAGVPEPFIAHMKSLVAAMSPIEFYSCFISYSSKDQEFAERLHSDLRSKNVRCWFAPEDLKIGDKLRPAFDEAIRVHDKLMVLLSEDSVGSPWVEKEVETAFEKEHREKRTVLFPIRLDEAVMETDQAWAADIRRTRHIGDFRNWKNHDSYKKAFDRLLRDLKAV